MNKETNVNFEACVVCDYVRHWDTHRINTDIGKLTDATLNEINVANRTFNFGYEKEIEFAFNFSHFHEDTTPDWFNETLERYPQSTASYPFKRGYLALLSSVTITQSQYQNVLRTQDGSPVEEGRFSDEELIDVYKDFVVSRLAEFSFLFSLAANIARPGSFQFTDRYLIQDHRPIRKIGGTLNSFEYAILISQKHSWPPINQLQVLDVWDWLIKIPGFTNGKSQSKLGRAVGALSYLLGDDYKDENELALVWALIGLEALYGKGNVGLKSQLMDKTESLLGKRTMFKKEFGQVYDFRSRLVHGDKNFHYKGFEVMPEDGFSNQLRVSEELAITILISTLQHMFSNNMQELDFRVIVDK